MRNARKLRRPKSLPEVLLWQRLRRRPRGLKFRRKHPVGGYVVDFYCPATKLPIEVDGEAHNRGDRPNSDLRRGAALIACGLSIMRVPAIDVLTDADAAADSILLAAMPLHHPAGGPPPHALHGEDFSGED